MKTFSILFLIVLLSCQPDAAVNTGNQRHERTDAAFIIDNSHIADGCEYYVRLAVNTGDSLETSHLRKPTSASLPIYRQALSDIPSASNSILKPVTIRYVETGKEVDLSCGWNIKYKVAEIDILAVTSR